VAPPIFIACAVGDNASRELFETLLKDEESHVDWLEHENNKKTRRVSARKLLLLSLLATRVIEAD
jgi:bacterioferritin (cytochrome b1)